MKQEVDVLICGGGPVGLLTAYCLARYGISTCIIEQNERAKQTMYGRAAMIAPRTLEMLDQLDLTDALGQIGFVVRGQASYKDGVRTESKSAASSDIKDTFFDYLLLCRQRYTEDIIREGYERYCKNSVEYGSRLLDFNLAEDKREPMVVSTIEDREGRQSTIRSKYLVGADGGHSKVRDLAGIPFEGEHSNRHWIRIDGIVETNMPEARRGICGIQSASHGSVLWACLDHGRTRVGFVLPEKLWKERGESITRDDVIGEARKALQPFTLEFKSVDWWTVYSVGQRLAAQYRINDRIFIAGDAAHTHSSGAAQGMNTGLHDAVNLSWKLAGHINSWLSDDVLETYATERRPIANRIIEQDKIVSIVIGGELPEQFRGDPNADPHEILTRTYEANAALNTGLGIVYPEDRLTVVASSSDHPQLKPGERGSDILLQRPGVRLPVRLHSLFKFNGKFTVVSFCGDPTRTKASIKRWRRILDGPESFKHYSADIFQYLTIVASTNEAGSPDERLGVPCFGNAFYDVDGSAHDRYGVPIQDGAIVVLRPDGVIGTASHLGNGEAVSQYFAHFITVGKAASTLDHRMDRVDGVEAGEVSLEPDPH